MSTRTAAGTTSTILVMVLASGEGRLTLVAWWEPARTRRALRAGGRGPDAAASGTTPPGARASGLPRRETPRRRAREERRTAWGERPPSAPVEPPALGGGAAGVDVVVMDAAGAGTPAGPGTPARAGTSAGGLAVSAAVPATLPDVATRCADRALLCVPGSSEGPGSEVTCLRRLAPPLRPKPRWGEEDFVRAESRGSTSWPAWAEPGRGCPEPCCGLLGRSARRPTAASRRAGARPGVLGRPSDTASPAAGAVSVLGVSEGDWVDLVARMALVGLA